MTSENNQRLDYNISQGVRFAELVKDETTEVHEAFKNMCEWAGITLREATDAGIPPLHAASVISAAINGAMMHAVMQAPQGEGDPRE